MTERERRALGLPPSAAQLALADSLRKNAERTVFEMSKSLAPTLAQVSELGRKLAETVGPSAAILASLKIDREMVIPAGDYRQTVRMVPVGVQRVRLDEDQMEQLVAKLSVRTASSSETASIDIAYNRKENILSRVSFGKSLSSSFIDKEKNQRLRLFEKVLRNSRPIATKNLAEYLEYTTKQTENLIQAVNKKISKDLDLPEPFIKGAPTGGYHINPRYLVHKH